MITADEIVKRFTYHAPTEAQKDAYHTLRKQFAELCVTIDNLCPDSREKSVAFTELETAMFWANAAIARNS